MKQNYARVVLLVVAIALLNYLTQIIVNLVQIPVFLDTWATALGVLIGGLPIGIAGGVLYNMAMAATLWGWSAWIWSLSSIWIAFVTWYFYRHNWLRLEKIWHVLGAGLILGFTNALITFQITILFFNGLPTYEPTAAINAFFLSLWGSKEVAAFIEHLIVELIDKTLIILIATALASKVKNFIGENS